jgi:hypothetical protein
LATLKAAAKPEFLFNKLTCLLKPGKEAEGSVTQLIFAHAVL